MSYPHTSHTCVGSVNECLWERHVTFSTQEDEYNKRWQSCMVVIAKLKTGMCFFLDSLRVNVAMTTRIA